MKLRVTLEQTKQISDSQKRLLTDLWNPRKYDVAVASMCMDVENEIYDEFEFVVGQTAIDKHAHIYIYDIRNIPIDNAESLDDNDSSIEETNEDNDEDEELYYEEEEDSEPDFDMTYTRPSFFNKEDCIPLLDIGQMIELLQRFDFGSADFFLNAGNGETGCEIGRSPSTWVDYNDQDPQELCDVLWEMVKMVLA